MQFTTAHHSRKEIVAAVLILAFTAICLLFVAYVRAQKTDFPSFYVAGRAVLHQRGALYSPHAQFVGQLALTGHNPRRFEPWAHLPLDALVVAPFALFPFSIAYLLWSLANLAGAGVLLYLLRDSVRNYVALAFVLIPAIAGLEVGQNHILPALCTLLLLRALKRKDETSAGLFLGLLFLRFQFAIPLTLFFVVARRWKLLGVAASIGTALFASSFLIAGPPFLSHYFEIAKVLRAGDESIARQMIGIPAAITVLIPNHTVALVCTAALSVALLAFALRVWRREPWAPDSDRFDVLFALAVFTSLAISFHAFMYDLTLAGVAAAVALRRIRCTIAHALLLPFFLVPFVHGKSGWLGSVFLVGTTVLLGRHLSSERSIATPPVIDQYDQQRLLVTEPPPDAATAMVNDCEPA